MSLVICSEETRKDFESVYPPKDWMTWNGFQYSGTEIVNRYPDKKVELDLQNARLEAWANCDRKAVFKHDLESRDLTLIRGTAKWLASRGATPYADKVNWGHMMKSYSEELNAVADKIEKLPLKQTEITLDSIFGKTKDDK